MPEWTAEKIAQSALDRDLIEEHDLRDLLGEMRNQDDDPEKIKQLLLRRELVTNYQLERLLRGDRNGFYYGKYKVLYQVGSGTFARVYRATHRETKEIRAVKVLRNRFLDDPEKREQFCREGEMGCTLRHPNVVPIYEVVSEPKSAYLVLEFVEGRNLRDFLKIRQRFEPLEATKLAIDICRGLDYAHQRGISHRDLKSSNVLVSSLGQAKLVDFGLAGADPELSDAELAEIENPRTIDYAALERTTGVRKDDARSDIFFLGCIYYHMLSGKPALEETRDRIARLSRQRFLEIKPIQDVRPELPHDVIAAVNKAMELEPAKRYQSPQEMLNDLHIIAAQKSAAAHVPSVANGKGRAPSPVPLKQRTLMIVESNVQTQENFREMFKQKGFRVLLTADPQRPASLFVTSAKPADCVIFSAAALGEEALTSFNEFGVLPATKAIPAVLLLGSKQQTWVGRALTNDHRATAAAPIKMKELLALFDKLMPADAS